ncbi:MAG: LysM peptidoglycan-binding domain-containing protein [Candidatus Shapirobacteria bacterium]|jgi:nucleoid-associated protein YgaU
MKRKDKLLTDSSKEDLMSMVLGLVIVGVVIGLLFNFIQRRKGNVSVPGVSNQISVADNVTLVPTETKVKNEEGGRYYKVENGDNLWDIAVKIYGNGHKWVEIAKRNNLADANLLSVGQELGLLSVDAAPGPSGEYIVKKGDSLWRISVDLYSDGMKWSDIWNQNRNLISDPNFIEVGTKLALP